MDTAGWWTGMKYRITAEGVLETGLSGFDLMNFPMPVSYTHLTLPTIYSV